MLIYLVLEVVDECDLHADLVANFIKTFFLHLWTNKLGRLPLESLFSMLLRVGQALAIISRLKVLIKKKQC
jgi:hypothetical protein